MNGEGVDGGCKMFGVDLSELFSPTVVFVVTIHHLVRHLPRSNPMNFKHLQKRTTFWTHVVTIKSFLPPLCLDNMHRELGTGVLSL